MCSLIITVRHEHSTELQAVGPTMTGDINVGQCLYFRSLLQLALFSSGPIWKGLMFSCL